MISAVILAAGASQRMGKPKALLTVGEKTFLQYIVDVLHSARILDIAVVLGADAEGIKQSLDWFDGKIVLNADWQKGQLTSVISGIDALDTNDLHGAMLCPVDRPLISQSLLVDLLQAFWKSKKNIVVPSYNGKRGDRTVR
jgi:molybdenum cofactor cytidylyltransferase